MSKWDFSRWVVCRKMRDAENISRDILKLNFN
jgi:hypothetical protein